jgi:hypothetical protein
MLKLTTKRYEVEEKIQLINENDEIIYEFDMQLTSEDLKTIQDILIGKDTLKMAKKINSFENKLLTEEEEEKILELSNQMNEDIIDAIGRICFKEHKNDFIEKGGDVKYLEMVEIISDFLLTYTMQKRLKRLNTMNTNLAKITKI